MKKTSFALFFFLIAASHCLAQDEETDDSNQKGFQKERLFFGGNLGATFGSYTQVIFSPQVGYHFNRYFAAGAGINGQYVGIKYFDNQGNEYAKETQGIYGLNLFGRLYPIRQAFIQVQPEFNFINGNYKYYNSNIPEQKYNTNAPSLLVSAGIGMGGAYVSLSYDVLQNPNAPYTSQPFISFGIGF